MAKRTHTFTMKFKMENAAFFNDGALSPDYEIVRILGELTQRIRTMDDNLEGRYPILDKNGNTIGEAKIT